MPLPLLLASFQDTQLVRSLPFPHLHPLYNDSKETEGVQPQQQYMPPKSVSVFSPQDALDDDEDDDLPPLVEAPPYTDADNFNTRLPEVPHAHPSHTHEPLSLTLSPTQRVGDGGGGGGGGMQFTFAMTMTPSAFGAAGTEATSAPISNNDRSDAYTLFPPPGLPHPPPTPRNNENVFHARTHSFSAHAQFQTHVQVQTPNVGADAPSPSNADAGSPSPAPSPSFAGDSVTTALGSESPSLDEQREPASGPYRSHSHLVVPHPHNPGGGGQGGGGGRKPPRPPSYIPRPPNAFILFRASFVRSQRMDNNNSSGGGSAITAHGVTTKGVSALGPGSVITIEASSSPSSNTTKNGKENKSQSSLFSGTGGGGGTGGGPAPSTSLSKLAGQIWRAMPAHERAVWETRARAAQAEHRAKYPDWRFRPENASGIGVGFGVGVDDWGGGPAAAAGPGTGGGTNTGGGGVGGGGTGTWKRGGGEEGSTSKRERKSRDRDRDKDKDKERKRGKERISTSTSVSAGTGTSVDPGGPSTNTSTSANRRTTTTATTTSLTQSQSTSVNPSPSPGLTTDASGSANQPIAISTAARGSAATSLDPSTLGLPAWAIAGLGFDTETNPTDVSSPGTATGQAENENAKEAKTMKSENEDADTVMKAKGTENGGGEASAVRSPQASGAEKKEKKEEEHAPSEANVPSAIQPTESDATTGKQQQQVRSREQDTRFAVPLTDIARRSTSAPCTEEMREGVPATPAVTMPGNGALRPSPVPAPASVSSNPFQALSPPSFRTHPPSAALPTHTRDRSITTMSVSSGSTASGGGGGVVRTARRNTTSSVSGAASRQLFRTGFPPSMNVGTGVGTAFGYGHGHGQHFLYEYGRGVGEFEHASPPPLSPSLSSPLSASSPTHTHGLASPSFSSAYVQPFSPSLVHHPHPHPHPHPYAHAHARLAAHQHHQHHQHYHPQAISSFSPVHPSPEGFSFTPVEPPFFQGTAGGEQESSSPEMSMDVEMQTQHIPGGGVGTSATTANANRFPQISSYSSLTGWAGSNTTNVEYGREYGSAAMGGGGTSGGNTTTLLPSPALSEFGGMGGMRGVLGISGAPASASALVQAHPYSYPSYADFETSAFPGYNNTYDAFGIGMSGGLGSVQNTNTNTTANTTTDLNLNLSEDVSGIAFGPGPSGTTGNSTPTPSPTEGAGGGGGGGGEGERENVFPLPVQERTASAQQPQQQQQQQPQQRVMAHERQPPPFPMQSSSAETAYGSPPAAGSPTYTPQYGGGVGSTAASATATTTEGPYVVERYSIPDTGSRMTRTKDKKR